MEEIVRELDRLMGQREYKKAEALLVYCREAAVQNGDEAAELSVCNELMGFYRMRSMEEGFRLAWQRTQELLSELDVGDLSRGTILISGATGLAAFGRAREAVPIYQKAYGCYLRRLDAGDYRFAALFNNLSASLADCGEFSQAEEHIRMAISVLEKLGHHPDLGTSYVNLAQLYARQDREDERVNECLDKAMACFDDPEMRWDGYYAHTAQKCAGAFAALGRQADADELEERAEMIYEGT